MAYQNNIPQATDRLKDSQSDIQDNFAEIETLVTVNHVDFGNPDQGKHKWVTFPVQGGAPSFATGEDGLYNLPYNNVGSGGPQLLNELFVHKQVAGGASVDIPFTASILSQDAAPLSGANGWSYLPSGILLRWANVTGTGPDTVTMDTATFPGFNTLYNVIITPVPTGPSFDLAVSFVSIASPNSFNVFVSKRTSTSATTGSFNFLAVGR